MAGLLICLGDDISIEGVLPRHPSQLYEALFEGVGLFIILGIVFVWFYREGLFSVFVIGYGIIRFFIEFTRARCSFGVISISIVNKYLSIIMIVLEGFGVWAV